MSDPDGVALLITHRTRPGQRDAVRAVWERHMAPAVTANSDNLAYHYYCADAEDDVVTAFQHYRSTEAAAPFLRTSAYLAYEQEVAPLLAGPPQVRQLRPLWVKAKP